MGNCWQVLNSKWHQIYVSKKIIPMVPELLSMEIWDMEYSHEKTPTANEAIVPLFINF
jgi:hypothetical protein